MWLVVGLVAVLVAAAGYWYGQKTGDTAGYVREKNEAKVAADTAAKKTAETANPFNNPQTNPLGNIKVNPFK